MCILETEASSRTVHDTLPSTSHSWYCSEGQRHISSFAYGVNFRHVFLPGEVLESMACKTACYRLCWGDWLESYARVPRVLTGMSLYNTGIIWFIHTGNMMLPHNGVYKHVLQRVFWCFPQCAESFQHCRPVILVDATFLMDKYKGTLMMAVADRCLTLPRNADSGRIELGKHL